MGSARQLFTTEYQGISSDNVFDGRSYVKNIASATISRITVMHGAYITTLTVHYTGDGPGTTWGGSDGTLDEVVLKPGEFITVIEGQTQAGGSCISQLVFVTNHGNRWGPYGRQIGTQVFTFNGGAVGGDMAWQMGLLYLSGNYHSWVTRLQATFARYVVPATPQKVVIYEKEAEDIPSSAPAGHSKFAQTLMSPIVTLSVGPDGIIFRAYEDTLCRLSFFRAALKGKFIEAVEKKVTMPEDEPEVVCALIQFLYDGTYTYTFKTARTPAKDPEIPPIELKEGFFHARVYALANKYDCQGLVDAAKKSLIDVLKGLKGIDIIRLLKETYDKGWAVTEWEEDSDMKEFRQGLPVLLKQLFASNREEMELIISECPAVGYDLMRLLVST